MCVSCQQHGVELHFIHIFPNAIVVLFVLHHPLVDCPLDVAVLLLVCLGDWSANCSPSERLSCFWDDLGVLMLCWFVCKYCLSPSCCGWLSCSFAYGFINDCNICTCRLSYRYSFVLRSITSSFLHACILSLLMSSVISFLHNSYCSDLFSVNADCPEFVSFVFARLFLHPSLWHHDWHGRDKSTNWMNEPKKLSKDVWANVFSQAEAV